MNTPVLNVLGVSHPLLFSPDEWLRRWVGWTSKMTWLSSNTIKSWTLSFSLESRSIWNTSISDIHLVFTPVSNVLSICHPLLLSSYKGLWRWKGWTSRNCISIFISRSSIRSFKLSCRLIGKSSICFISLVVWPIINILSIVHPLLFASYEWLWWWQCWSSWSSKSIRTLRKAMNLSR